MTKAAELAKMGEVLTNSQIGGRRNIVINGAMQVAQRSTSVTGLGGTSDTGYQTVDRFRMTCGSTAGRFTQSQVADVHDGFAYALKLDCTTADTSIAAGESTILETRFEGQDLQQLKKGTSDAEKFTVSFYVKGNGNATYTCELRDQDNTRNISQEFAVTSSWNRIILTFNNETSNALDNDNASSMVLNIWLHAGANFTSGTHAVNTWHTTNANRLSDSQSSFFSSTDNTFFITGLQMEVGSQATPFEHRSFGEELALCERYFYKWINTGLSDQFAFYSPYSPAQVSAGLPNSSAISPHTFPVTMRASPTMTTTISGGSLNRQTSTPFGFVAQMSSTSTGGHYVTQYLASSEL